MDYLRNIQADFWLIHVCSHTQEDKRDGAKAHLSAMAE